MLSRVKNSDDLRILRPFQKAKITTQVSEDLRKEFKRLQYLHMLTTNPSSIETTIPTITTLGGEQELEKIK